MTLQGWLPIVAILFALTRPVGIWLFALYDGRRTPLHVVLGSVERGFYSWPGNQSTIENILRAVSRYGLRMSCLRDVRPQRR